MWYEYAINDYEYECEHEGFFKQYLLLLLVVSLKIEK